MLKLYTVKASNYENVFYVVATSFADAESKFRSSRSNVNDYDYEIEEISLVVDNTMLITE